MNNYSLTQKGNLIVLASFIVLMAKVFGVELVQEEIVQILIAVTLLAGFIMSWIGRYRKGDLTVAGFRK